MEYDFPSVEAPEYLARLNPHLYQQEQARISHRFDEAVRLAEEAFTSEFSKLVSHLTERLADRTGGHRHWLGRGAGGGSGDRLVDERAI